MWSYNSINHLRLVAPSSTETTSHGTMYMVNKPLHIIFSYTSSPLGCCLDNYVVRFISSRLSADNTIEFIASSIMFHWSKDVSLAVIYVACFTFCRQKCIKTFIDPILWLRNVLAQWILDKLVAMWLTIFSSENSVMIWLKFSWSFFPRVPLTIHRFR